MATHCTFGDLTHTLHFIQRPTLSLKPPNLDRPVDRPISQPRTNTDLEARPSFDVKLKLEHPSLLFDFSRPQENGWTIRVNTGDTERLSTPYGANSTPSGLPLPATTCCFEIHQHVVLIGGPTATAWLPRRSVTAGCSRATAHINLPEYLPGQFGIHSQSFRRYLHARQCDCYARHCGRVLHSGQCRFRRLNHSIWLPDYSNTGLSV